MIKPGIISYIPNNSLIEASGLIHAIHMITTRAPAIIPLTAPARVRSFQYSENKTSGLNAAPKPAQALPTRLRMV